MRKLLLIFYVIFSLVNLNASEKSTSYFNKSIGFDGESYISFAYNGSWSSLSNPSVIYSNGFTYTGWIDNYGNITIGKYEHKTGEITTQLIKKDAPITDSNNPVLILDKDNKVLVFYLDYTNNSRSIRMVKSLKPESILEWQDEVVVSNNITNTSKFTPVILNKSNNTIALVYNTPNMKVAIATQSESLNWSTQYIDFNRKEFSKAMSNGEGDLKLILNSLDGSIFFTESKDNSIKFTNNVELYNSDNLGKAFVYDAATNDNNEIAIAYITSNKKNEYSYQYSKWNGKKWQSFNLINTKETFVMPYNGKSLKNLNLTGGMTIDPDNLNDVYLSINRSSVFEIEKWSTKNNGKSWNITAITQNSDKNNIRPIAVQNTLEDNPLQVTWMLNTTYYSDNYTKDGEVEWADRFQSAIKIGIQSPMITDVFDPKQIIQIMRQTTDWQFANPYDLRRLSDWHWGTYYVGLEEQYSISPKDRDIQEMINIGNGENWKLHDKIFYVDMITVVSNWAWLYEKIGDPKMIQNSQWALDVHLATRRKYKADVRFAGNPYFDEWWTWCDALFVAPPAFAAMYSATGEKKYLDYMDEMYWITKEYLYSPSDSLMFRDDRYFDQRTENGKKIFWGRGNGWVIGGLSRIINYLPEDYPSRPRYEKMFKEMADKLISLQGDDDGWRVSLLDPEYQDEAEMSGSAFYVYSLAWGINKGLLDKSYLPNVKRGWAKLCSNVNRNGRFGNVQSEGIDPRNFDETEWQVYGTGAFLMAGKEMYQLITNEINK